MPLEIGTLEVAYSPNRIPTYRLTIAHRELRKHRVITGKDKQVVQRKAELQIEDWNLRWGRAKQREALNHERRITKEHIETQKELAAALTDEAVASQLMLEQLLHHTLDIDDAIDWAQLKDKSPFSEPAPGMLPLPTPPPERPNPNSAAYQPEFSFLDKLVASRRAQKMRIAAEQFDADMRESVKQWAEYEAAVDVIKVEHANKTKQWSIRKQRFLEKQRRANEAIEERKKLYESKNADAVEEYCDMVLSRSQYPDWLPQEWEIGFNANNGTLIVEYKLPALEDLPTLTEVRYVQSRAEFVEKHMSEAAKNRAYDSIIYQIVLRTIHELYEADVVHAIEAIVFNGIVTSTDRSTGHKVTACIVSLQAVREEFLSINLAAVDPKACFKALKGIGSSRLHSLTPIPPVVTLLKEDSRFVSAREVVDTLDDGVNLAAMDWEDFEHLVRELFEQEFAAGGGEVRVTQASRDGGVDAIAFDPDPIRGGKIVIQAKRYTNTVGVSAVRDLYGTVHNEGANKGILVTTSDYGPDAYSFAKDKPITLLSGANLLHLLEKHGHRAKIDIAEARRLAD